MASVTITAPTRDLFKFQAIASWPCPAAAVLPTCARSLEHSSFALALAALTGLALGSGCETQAAGVEDSLRRVLRAAGAKAMSWGLSKADPVNPQ